MKSLKVKIAILLLGVFIIWASFLSFTSFSEPSRWIHIAELQLPSLPILFMLLVSLLLVYFLLENWIGEKLESNQATVDRLFWSNPQPMFVYEIKKGRILAANAAAEVVYGYNPSEWSDLSVWDIYAKEEIEGLKASLQNPNPDYHKSFSQHIKRGGHIFQVAVQEHPYHHKGQSCRLIIVQDLQDLLDTRLENHRLASQVSENEQFLQSILENINEVIWSRRVSDLALLFISPATLKHYGLPPQEIINDAQPWFDRVHPEDQATLQAYHEKILQSGYYAVEYRYQHPDGSLRHILDRASLTYDEQGQPSIIYGVATDITAVYQLKEQIRQSEQHLITLTDSSDDIMLLLDPEFKPLMANQALFKTINRYLDEQVEDLNDLKFFRNIPQHLYEFWLERLLKVLKGQRIQEKIPPLYLLPDDRSYEVLLQPVWDKEEVIAIACFARDTTLQNLREERIILQNEKFKEIALVQSHDVRPALANLIGLLRLLDRQNLNSKENKELLEKMDKVSQHLDDIIRRVVLMAQEIESMDAPIPTEYEATDSSGE